MSAGHALLAKHVSSPSTQANEEDATIKVAERVSKLVRRRPVAESEKPVAGHLTHSGFGAAMGVLYGLAAAATPVVTIGAGAGFGAAVWLGAHVIVVPMLGLARSPWREPARREALEFALHIIYGVTLGLVHRAVVRISR